MSEDEPDNLELTPQEIERKPVETDRQKQQRMKKAPMKTSELNITFSKHVAELMRQKYGNDFLTRKDVSISAENEQNDNLVIKGKDCIIQEHKMNPFSRNNSNIKCKKSQVYEGTSEEMEHKTTKKHKK